MLAGNAHLAIRSDRRDHLPYGLFGGKPATGSLNRLQRAEGSEILPVMISSTMHAQETLYHRQPGGGGFGDPLKRVPQRVADDVRNEKVSRAAARQEYGVVLQGDSCEVDVAATAALRQTLALPRSPASGQQHD